MSDVSLLFNGGIDWDMKSGEYRQYFRLRHPRETPEGAAAPRLGISALEKRHKLLARLRLLHSFTST